MKQNQSSRVIPNNVLAIFIFIMIIIIYLLPTTKIFGYKLKTNLK